MPQTNIIARLCLKIQWYGYTARWIAAKNTDADGLNGVVSGESKTREELAEGVFIVIYNILAAIKGSDKEILDPVLEKVKVAIAADPIMTEFWQLIQDEFLNYRCNPPETVRPYWPILNQLSLPMTWWLSVFD